MSAARDGECATRRALPYFAVGRVPYFAQRGHQLLRRPLQAFVTVDREDVVLGPYSYQTIRTPYRLLRLGRGVYFVQGVQRRRCLRPTLDLYMTGCTWENMSVGRDQRATRLTF